MTDPDNGDDTVLLGIAASISNGERVDWEDVRRTVGSTAPALVEALEVLDGIAHLHRTEWGPLEVLEPIGHGSFGTVYRAFDRNLQRHVALKVTRLHAGDAGFNPDQLVQEARRLARVKHSNVVSVLSAERVGDEIGVAMEWIKGQTLDAIVHESGPMGAREAALIGIDVCRALAAVHAAGLLHGDVKAHNVMREAGGRIVLMDFGASRDLARPPHPGNDFAGTPLYMAPEVFAGASRSAASDVYSVGVLLYFLATGRYPVEGDTRTMLDREHAKVSGQRQLRDVRPDLPEDFVRVVQRATSQNPSERYATAGTLNGALESFLTRSGSTRRRPLAPLMVAAALVLAVGGGALFLGRPRVAASRASSVPPPTTASEIVVPYTIEAAMYRVEETGATRLDAHSRVHPDDRLYLQVNASVPVHVYVVNEDDEKRAFVLFPISGFSEHNPLRPGETHRLPGSRAGLERYYWQVSVPGRREHFIIFVSPAPLNALDTMLASLPRASEDTPVLSAELAGALGTLRGVGGIATATTPRGDRPLFEQFRTELPAGAETTTEPVWVRQLTVVSEP